jgi:ubiquinone/menaquinone biosynthesis C-methylase UbiE
MSYRPEEGRIECRRTSRVLKEVDAKIQCSAFKAKEQDLAMILESTKRYYDEIGNEYDDLWYSPQARIQYNKLYSFLQRKMAHLSSPGELVLDAGCGTCEWSTILMKNQALVVGFDQSIEMLQIGKEKSISRGVQTNLDLILGDLELLPYKERTFDGITILFVLGHLPDDKIRNFLDELARVIKEEAWMLFADGRFREPHQRQELQVRTLKSGKEYTVYKRYFTAVELKTVLEKRFHRSFSALEIDRYAICTSNRS